MKTNYRQIYRQIFFKYYIVRTQSGFKQALKHFYKIKKIDDNISGYPESYPSLVCFNYNEYIGYVCDCIPINFLLNEIKGE